MQRLATAAGGELRVTQAEWIGPYTAPKQYTIALPSGQAIDAQWMLLQAQGYAPGEASLQQLMGPSVSTYQVAEEYGGLLIPPPVVTEVETAPAGSMPVERAPEGVTTIPPGSTEMITGDVAAPTIADRVHELSGYAEALNADQWNYYYSQVTGIAGPVPEDIGFTGGNRYAQVDVDTWWAAVNGTPPFPEAAGILEEWMPAVEKIPPFIIPPFEVPTPAPGIQGWHILVAVVVLILLLR